MRAVQVAGTARGRRAMLLWRFGEGSGAHPPGTSQKD
jgi:hypothetical protein